MVTAIVFGSLVGILILRKLPPQVPVFYSRPWGENQLGKPIELLIPVGCSWFFAWLTIQINRRFQIDETLKVLIMGAAIVAEIIMLAGILRIIFVIS